VLNGIDYIRGLLNYFIDTDELSDIEVLRIIEGESLKRDSFLKGVEMMLTKEVYKEYVPTRKHKNNALKYLEDERQAKETYRDKVIERMKKIKHENNS